MTPYEKAEQILDQLVTAAAAAGVVLPERRYALVAEPVVDCESVIIALTGVTQPELFDPSCGVPQLGTFSVIIARDCAGTANQDGTTNIERATVASAAQAIDGDLLWSFANGYQEFVSKTWNIGYVVTGDLAITSMLFTTGID